MVSDRILVEVAYAAKEKQLVIPVELPQGAVLEEAVKRSGILQEFPNIELSRNKVGVFGKLGKLTQPLASGDRVEIYRPLYQHPMEARRNRAAR